MKAFILVMAALGFIGQAQARTERVYTTFGAEFTFGIPPGDSDAKKKVIDRQNAHLIDGQPEGEKFWHPAVVPDSSLFISPNGWFFSTGTDPGVIEVRTSPHTVEFWRQFKDDMHDAIFVSAANEGYFPQAFMGGGHINVGLSGFGANSLLIRNFVVDLFNHNELFMGVFNYDTNNALPFGLFPYDTEMQIKKLIHTFDQGKYIGESGVVDFLKELNNLIFNGDDAFLKKWNKSSSRCKFSAVNFSNISMGPDSRIEIRGVRPQASMDVWVHQIELLQNRINYLATFHEPIPLKLNTPLERPIIVEFEGHALNPPVDPQKALEAFHLYVLEAGSKWADQRSYLWPKWLQDGEVDRYEASETFHIYEETYRREACERALAAVP